MRRPGRLVALVLSVGLAGSAFALRQHEGDSLLAAEQQGLSAVSAVSVQGLLLSTRDPRPGHGGRALSARCAPGSHSPLGDPWSCIVTYPHATPVRFGVSVYGDRSVYASGLPLDSSTGTPLTVRGCCVSSP